MNQLIIRSYFTHSMLETVNSTYRRKIHADFIAQFPHLFVSEQRVADQKRVILQNKLLPDSDIEKIKIEVAKALGIDPATGTRVAATPNHVGPYTRQENQHPFMEIGPNRPSTTRRPVVEGPVIRTQFEETLREFRDTHPTHRHILPRQFDNPDLKDIVRTLNEQILPHYIISDATFEEIHLILHCAAATAIRCNGGRTLPPKKILRNKQIHSKYEAGNRKLIEHKDTLTQKLSVLSERLRRIKDAAKRREHSAQFSKNPEGFYMSLNPTNRREPIKPPQPTEMQEFWSRRVEHNRQAPWIAKSQEKLEDTPPMVFEEITATDLAEAIRKTHIWKAPGPDRIRNFWLKKFSFAHPFLARHLTGLDNGACDPSKFRPITCLCALYKALTSCLTAKIYQHRDCNNLVAEEQKGCRKKSRGCKEQVLIDSVLLEQAKRNRRSLCTAFIHYKKAFDSVPHSWLLETPVAHKIHPAIVKFLGHVTSTWRTKLSLNHGSSTVTTEYVPIKRGP
ncbi:UNVERIFIED_CONTAM: hypothetical protein PYX00_010800 [Menopon gallinae]|uniref:Reverse transcriptase domain-containing protein n=1 Tax=Menopon gallinae TaxID=328185 RepID=A0AAW2HHA3_9NEOP